MSFNSNHRRLAGQGFRIDRITSDDVQRVLNGDATCSLPLGCLAIKVLL